MFKIRNISCFSKLSRLNYIEFTKLLNFHVKIGILNFFCYMPMHIFFKKYTLPVKITINLSHNTFYIHIN